MNIPIILRGAAQTEAQFESSNNFWKEGEISLVGNKIYIAKSSGLKNDIDFVVFDANDVTGDLQSDLLDHIQDASNPHSVTKAQVGLGNVDNTSDANKPISIATQESLDSKILYVAGRPESDPTFEDSVPMLLHDDDEVWFMPPNTPQGNAIVLAKSAIDPDAAAWIAAVEAEDGQALEAGVKQAVGDFVKGLKNDGIWPAIKSACILGGARTLGGALIPLVGSAPTNTNFVQGDLDRVTGLKGNGSKFLDSNYSFTSAQQNNAHIAVYRTSAESASITEATLGNATGTDGSQLATSSNFRAIRLNSNFSFQDSSRITGFLGGSRNSSNSFTYRYDKTSITETLSSVSVVTNSFTVFARGGSNPSFARMLFYSIGESLDLALLESRIDQLAADFDAAIP